MEDVSAFLETTGFVAKALFVEFEKKVFLFELRTVLTGTCEASIVCYIDISWRPFHCYFPQVRTANTTKSRGNDFEKLFASGLGFFVLTTAPTSCF